MHYVTIVSTVTVGLYLEAGGTVTNPASTTILSSVGVEIANGYGVVINSGEIAGMAWVHYPASPPYRLLQQPAEGVYLRAGGSVTNTSTGTILAGTDGVYIRGGAGAVVNYGTITGYYAGGPNAFFGGIVLTGGGSVTNAASASISDGNHGIRISGGAGTVFNAGTITGGGGEPVSLYDGGSVTNAASGSITGPSGVAGVRILNTAGTVINDGTIAGSSGGIAMSAGGYVTNAASASISAGNQGVYIEGVGTVVNDGRIAGTAGLGVHLSSGSVTNAASASIAGGLSGVVIDTSIGTVVNAGSIVGTAAYGVELISGSVTNAASASIVGGNDGVIINAASGTVSNYGSIAGTAVDGVVLSVGGYVTNASVGSVTGGENGIQVAGAPGTVVNAGSVVGTSGSGVVMADAGEVTNAASASIAGGQYGVLIRDAGTVVNAASASIAGDNDGVVIRGAGTVVNSGGITGTTNSGIYIYSGSVTNAASALISGGGYGLLISRDIGTVVNDGIIAGGSVAGVVLASGGTLTTAGTITGTGGAAVLLRGSDSTLVFDPNAVFNGTVSATGSGNTLDLASGGSAGTITGLGSNYIGFGQINVAAFASWTLDGTNTVASGQTLTDGGTLVVASYLSNSGSIAGGVTLDAGTRLTDASGATIGGSAGDAIYSTSTGAGVSVINAGSVYSSSTRSVVGLHDGGYVSNASTGTISSGAGGGVAIYVTGASAGVINFGLINGAGEVYLADGGSVTNYGTIDGTDGGVAGHGVTVLNAGLMGRVNFSLSGGTVTNQAGGIIDGTPLSAAGVNINGAAGTVVNAGTIIGGAQPAIFLGGTYANRVVVDPGAVFIGDVNGGNMVASTLELASAATAGSLSGLSSKYSDFAQVTVDSNASWTLTGGNAIAAGATLINSGTLSLTGATLSDAGALENDGAIVLDPSTLTVAGLTGTGSVTIEAGSMLEAQGTIAGGETLVFAGSGAYLHLDAPNSVAGSVTNFDVGETIDLKAIDPASVNYSGGLLNFGGGSFALSLANAGTVTASASGDGARIIVRCFRANTLIQTPGGEIAVQNLAVGDAVLTQSGEVRHIEEFAIGDHRRARFTSTTPVKWIGRRHVDCRRHPMSHKVWPVRVRAGAFGDGMPRRDLWLSPDHAVNVEDVLIPIKHLINGTSIEQVPVDKVTYYHIELPEHDVLLAEGLPVESYLDTGDRFNFENGGGPIALHPEFSACGWDTALKWEALGCAPLIVTGPRLDAVRQQVNNRATIKAAAAGNGSRTIRWA